MKWNQEVQPVQTVQTNIYQINTDGKDLIWLYFDDEPRVQVLQQVKDQQSYISFSEVYLTYPSSSQDHQRSHDSSIPCKVTLQIYRDKEQPQEKETSQNESRLQFSSVLAIETEQKPQFNLEGKDNSNMLKYDFSSRTDSSIFRSQLQLLLQIGCL